ncbi:NAD(P)-dependent oxidoreductase [Paenarthrobacter sp. NPDC089675]|uniref:NAD(P)-dependent oxidoreductase n=1 Tax=Paenarthrobacter sp. NPDC089675 TaxID=3364376 RepID=UPI00382E1C2F
MAINESGHKKRAGFVGLGLMGAPMAANIAAAGWEVSAWNRSTSAFDLVPAVSRVATVAELRDEPSIIFMLPDLPFIEAAAIDLLESWRAQPPRPGTAVVIMSSVSPAHVKQFAETVREASAGNAVVIDAPVSGGTVGARNGTLAIMVGASPEDFERLQPLLATMGTTVRRMGPLGSGSLAKACNQLIVGTTTAALAEAAELAERSGMEVEALFDVLSGGLAGSRVLDVVGPRLAHKDYTPTGPAKFMHKDLGFVVDSAKSAGSAVPMAAAAIELYAELKRQGLGDHDLAVVRQTIANLGPVTAGSQGTN